MTRSEVVCVLRASRAKREREYDMSIFLAWRTATLVRARKLPPLARLLRKVKRKSAAEKAEVRAAVAAAEAEFARLEAQARGGSDDA